MRKFVFSAALVLMSLFFIVLTVLLAGCDANNADIEEARAEIVGKWQTYAFGVTEDDLEIAWSYGLTKDDPNYYEHYIEYTEDGLIYVYDENNVYEKYVLKGKYNLDANYLYQYHTEGTLADKFEYTFEKETMKLTNTKKCTPGANFIGCTNIKIYKRLE